MSEPSNPETDPVARAREANRALMHHVDRQAESPPQVLKPCLDMYKAEAGPPEDPEDCLGNLTSYLIGAREETEADIRRRFEQKHAGKPDAARLIESSVTNSLRRSAGTNYQALVSYAMARHLEAIGSTWYVQKPVPKEFKEALTIRFDVTEAVAGSEEESLDAESEDEDDSIADVGFTVQPDVDILIRDAAWDGSDREPIALLSVKTSLVDRAGQAARWKTYFELATHPCPLRHEHEECVYPRFGIRMDNADVYEIEHGIVTANIYKYQFADERYRKGELASGQTRSNTGMFEWKFTTRDDQEAETPADWRQFPQVKKLLERLESRAG